MDRTLAPNSANEGIAKSLAERDRRRAAATGLTPDSSAFIIARDPFRAIRRGRQIFQRKFTRTEGHGPRASDGIGDIRPTWRSAPASPTAAPACHGRPRGSAGSAATSSRAPTAATRPTCSASA